MLLLSWGSPLASLTRLIVLVIWVYMWVWGQQLLPFLIWLELQGLCSPGKQWKFLALNLKWSPWCQALLWDCGWGSQGHSRGANSSSSPPSGLRNFVSYPQCTKTTSDSSLFWNNLNSCKLVGPRDQIANIHWTIEKPREFQKNIYCFIGYARAFDCVDHNKLWKIIKVMGIPDHLTCLLRSLHAGQEATVRIGYRTMNWF